MQKILNIFDKKSKKAHYLEEDGPDDDNYNQNNDTKEIVFNVVNELPSTNEGVN